MNKKTKIVLISIILIVILAVIIFFVVKYVNDSKNSTQPIQDNTTNSSDIVTSKVVNIQSTAENPIQMNDIEATNIEVVYNFGELQISTTLKNNSTETLNGFFIEIALLDENSDTVSTIAQNSEETIEPNQEITIINNVAGFDNQINIVNAKVVSIEKNTTQSNIEDSLEEMEQSIQSNVE